MANQSKPPDEHTRAVLEGVPRVSYEPQEGRVELTPFPSCLKACLEFLGEDYAYEYLMGASGAAFRLLWNPGKWDGANVDLIVMASDSLLPYRQAFDAVGYAYEIFGNIDVDHEASDQVRFFEKYADYTRFRRLIVESIGVIGRPVIGFGVIGPPECCIISGYDDDGDVLIGWNFFQDMPEFAAGVEFEPSGYFRKRHWYKNSPGLIVIGDKRCEPPLDEIYRKALKWALEVVRTPEVHERQSGLAAYTAWADDLLRDEEFSATDIAVLNERMMAHNDAMTMVAEGRWYAMKFLLRVAESHPPMAEELLLAASCYAAEHDLMWRGWGLVGGIGWSEAHVRKLADPEVRRQLAPIVLQARDRDAEAAEHIERALAK